MTSTISARSSVQEDFSRDVWCLFGLPVDNLSLSQTCRLIEQDVIKKKKAFLSTININWIVTSIEKEPFRLSIIESDICVIDGVPLLWLAKMIGLPMVETVPGSSLAQSLSDKTYTQNQLSIFLFGGNDNVGELAQKRLLQHSKGLKPVGYFNPGFGPAVESKTGEALSIINEQNPGILLVALGALKGQMWIIDNLPNIQSSVIAHLGATINFLAGSLKRAPLWVQKIGFEWAWRIIEEPNLAKRYFKDGIFILRLLIKNFITFLTIQYSTGKNREKSINSDLIVDVKNSENLSIIKFGQVPLPENRSELRQIFVSTVERKVDLELDFSCTKSIDHSTLGLILLVFKHQYRNAKDLKIVGVSRKLDQIFKFNLIDKSLAALDFQQWEKLKKHKI